MPACTSRRISSRWWSRRCSPARRRKWSGSGARRKQREKERRLVATRTRRFAARTAGRFLNASLSLFLSLSLLFQPRDGIERNLILSADLKVQVGSLRRILAADGSHRGAAHDLIPGFHRCALQLPIE